MIPINILVVDDEPDVKSLILQKFRKKIAAGEYEFSFAGDGKEALERLTSNGSINLVLADINMPVMDGLTLLTKIKEINKPVLRSVIISAYGDLENIRVAMNRGAFDFITKPIDFSDLEITIEKSLKEIETYKQALSSREKLVALQQELDIATVIQTSILPKIFPPFPDRKEFDIFAKMQPAREVGGDLYDFFLIDKNRLGIIIGDVSGKGIAAALLMAVSKTLLKATALKGLPADNILDEVNKILVDDSPSNMFVTVFYGVLDTRSGAFEYSNGGHNLPVIISRDGTVRILDNAGGLVLGAFSGAEYQSNIILLKPGDMIFMYTDGVTEAMNTDEELFTEERLAECLSGKENFMPKDLIQIVFDEVRNFSNGIEQADDITCLALKFFGK
jgi:sigma-B regulation protein RsbU (phosphoserine phosphatase)